MGSTWLMVDDAPGDAYLVQLALAECTLPVELHLAADGVEALAFLRHEGAYTTAPRPDLILLDIGMPRKNGLEVLQEIKRDGDLKRIPVVMFSGSRNTEEIRNCYALGANAHMKKPVRLETYRALVKTIFAVWCEHQKQDAP